jgi:DNA polymerase
MKKLWIDIETRSRCDLLKHGVYRYAADPSTEILIICHAQDDGPIGTWCKGQPLPARLVGLFAKPPAGLIFAAHSAGFERQLLGRRFPALMDPRRWYCTATQARAAALAGSLENASRMLGTTIAKDRRGAELIRLLSMPQADGSFLEDAGLMAEFARYCATDVAVMRQLSQGLPPLTGEALALYAASEAVNDRGLPIDTELCAAALRYAEQAAAEAAVRILAVTGGAIKSARGTLLTRWVYERLTAAHRPLMEVVRTKATGVITPGGARGVGNLSPDMMARAAQTVQQPGLTFDQSTRAALLDAIEAAPDDFTPEVMAAIEAAEDAAMSSVAKFGTMLDRVSADGRLRGAFVLNGASQTGRFSSTGAQLHNFPRLVADDPDALRALIVQRGDLGGSVLNTLKSMLRPAVRSVKGAIVRADWNAVEARALPWLAGPAADSYLDLWRDRARDPYIEQARLAGLGDHRQAGKVVVLSLGYGGGPNALMRMGKNYGVAIATPQQVVWSWRGANPWAGEWWAKLEGAAYTALRKRDGNWVEAGHIGLAADAYGLAMRLPSGRCLRYPFAAFEWQGEQSRITYLKAAWLPKAGATAWPRATLWHGTLAENATQATCGDLLRSAIVAAVDAGLPLIGHVHDELIAESAGTKISVLRELRSLLTQGMLQLPAWATKLPLAVDTDCASYFRK